MISPPSSPLPLHSSCIKVYINGPSGIANGNEQYQEAAFFEMNLVDGELWRDLIPRTVEAKAKLFLGQGNHANVYQGLTPLESSTPLTNFYSTDLHDNQGTTDSGKKIAVKVFHKEDSNALFIALRELYFQSEFFKASPSLGLQAFGVFVTYRNFMFFITKIDHAHAHAQWVSISDVRYSQAALLMELGVNGPLTGIPKRIITSDFILHMGVHLSKMLVSLSDLHCVHGDIKPHNLFPFFPTGNAPQIKLGDFSSTIRTSALDSETLAASCGTQAYLAPDLLLSNMPPLEAIKGGDTYAIGATLWSLITGHAPFEGIASSVHRLIAIKRGFLECGQNPWKTSPLNASCLVLPSGETISTKLSRDIISIIESLLRKESSKRPSPQNLLQAFQRLLNDK